MKLSFIIFILLFIFKASNAEDNRKFYEGRAAFIKEYIADIKNKRKDDKNFKGSVVETMWGKLYTRYGTQSQEELDNQTLTDCKKDGGIECLVRFRSLSVNKNYNRYALYDNSKKILKVLDQYISAKKVYSVKGIDILIAEKDYKNKQNFQCTKNKSNYRDTISILKKEIELYPSSFLNKSGLKYVMICEVVSDRGVIPAGLAPGHYDKSPGVFYVNISEINSHGKRKVELLKHLFHHEFYHVIDAELSKVYLDDQWSALNNQSYSDELIIDSNVIDNSVKGYISKYARNSAAEDKAELYAFMITQHKNFKKVLKTDPILVKKSQLMISRLKSISKDINKNFWKKLN